LSVSRDRDIEVVRQVRVAGDYRVDVGVGAVDYLAEARVVCRSCERRRGRALVHEQHDDVCLAVARVTVAELVGHPVDLGTTGFTSRVAIPPG